MGFIFVSEFIILMKRIPYSQLKSVHAVNDKAGQVAARRDFRVLGANSSRNLMRGGADCLQIGQHRRLEQNTACANSGLGALKLVNYGISSRRESRRGAVADCERRK